MSYDNKHVLECLNHPQVDGRYFNRTEPTLYKGINKDFVFVMYPWTSYWWGKFEPIEDEV